MNTRRAKFTFIIVIIWLLSFVGIATLARVAIIDNNQPTQNNLGACIKWDEDRVCTGSFVGLTETEAQALAKRIGLEYRVVERDEKGAKYTQELVANRINVHVKNGSVVWAEFDRPPIQRFQQ